MLGETKIRKLLKLALDSSRAGQTEVVISVEDSSLTRFANSSIHQNVHERNGSLLVRAAFGKKIGIATTNILTEESIRGTVKQACEIAAIQKEHPDFISLPPPGKAAAAPAPGSCVEATAECTPRERAEKVGLICRRAAKSGARAFGAFSTGVVEIAVANSLGVRQYHRCTDATLNAVVMTDSGAGYAMGASRDVRKIKCREIAETAVRKAVDSRHPVEVAPGTYPVVLEEPAAATMLDFLNYTGFSAMAVQEGRSFMGRNLGKPVMGANITIVDDARNRRGFAFPFDFEGTPKRPVTLVDGGVARAVVYDSLTAGKAGQPNTGHALPAPAYYPMACNLELRPGETPVEQMIASIERGIYVTRFHYVNLIDPMEVSITGMTRDGTFLIEHGRITRPVRNLRFTQSVLQAFNKISALSPRTTLVSEGDSYGHRFATGTLVPALKIDEFNFTGVTEF